MAERVRENDRDRKRKTPRDTYTESKRQMFR